MEKKRKMGIMAKLLIGIIPVVIIGINVVSFVSGQMASDALNAVTDSRVNAETSAYINSIDGKLQEIRTSAELLSMYVGDSYKATSLASYRRLFSSVISENELINGAGIWFEPKTYSGELAYAFKDYVAKEKAELIQKYRLNASDEPPIQSRYRSGPANETSA